MYPCRAAPRWLGMPGLEPGQRADLAHLFGRGFDVRVRKTVSVDLTGNNLSNTEALASVPV
jgi:hypothetical protein